MDLQWPLLFSLPLLSICFLYLIRKPQPQGSVRQYPIIGNMPQFIKNRHRFFDWTTDLLAAAPTNTITFHRFSNLHGVITANPANVEHVLKTNFENYPKGPRVQSILQDFLGTGIFNSDGHQWRVQRKTASFEFNTRSLRNFVVENVQKETDARLLPLLKRAAAAGEALDIQDVLERYAFDNVCKVTFGEDPACLASDAAPAPHPQGDNTKLSSSFADAFRDAANISAGRFRYTIPSFWKIKKLLGIGSEKRLKESIAVVHDFATRIIRSRVEEKVLHSRAQSDDLLLRFVANEEFSEEFLRDIVISFILAGRETTSSALTWFFWLLSSSPEVERKILEEIASVRAKRSGNSCNCTTFEFEELKDMQYLHAAITESMRLYPPVPSNTTLCQQDEVLPDGTEVKKNWFVSYQSYAMGRMESIWGKDCLEYKPERWMDEGGMFRPESQFKFPVFHGGPRICLGKEMAYIQMKSIAACVLERFTVEVVDRRKVPVKMLSLTLRMRGGLLVRVSDRRAAGKV